jgi:hypothetical protein
MTTMTATINGSTLRSKTNCENVETHLKMNGLGASALFTIDFTIMIKIIMMIIITSQWTASVV